MFNHINICAQFYFTGLMEQGCQKTNEAGAQVDGVPLQSSKREENEGFIGCSNFFAFCCCSYEDCSSKGSIGTKSYGNSAVPTGDYYSTLI